MSSRDYQYKIEETFEILDAFLEYFASKLSLKAIVSILVVTLVIPGVILLTGRSNRISHVGTAIKQAKVLSASGKYVKAVELLLSVKDKKMNRQLKKELVTQLIKDQRLMNEGVVAGVRVESSGSKVAKTPYMITPSQVVESSVNSVHLPTVTPAAEPVLTPVSMTDIQAGAGPINPDAVIKALTPEGVQFFEKIETLRQQGQIFGEPYTEVIFDPVVEVNPEADSVRVGLKYPTIEEVVDEEDKRLILNDFYLIKRIAEEDQTLIDPNFKVVGFLVLAFHDCLGKARGDLQLVIMDKDPVWDFWQ
ncbi:MAG TPA: hypothetical protein VMW41_04890 [Candidatus Bathyarchaeia archaeon]|nr:hypothetical protein [Candidatus Bathyarchaeia archaeon]